MAQTKTIQLLRSSQLYVPSGSGSEAKTALENAKAALTALTGRKDGEIVLARYQETGADIKSVLGIYHTTPNLLGGSTPGWTFIQDITSSSEGMTQLQAEIARIESNVGLGNDGTYTSGYSDDGIVGTPATLKATVDAIVSYIKGMDLTEVGGTSGDVITAVSQADGKVSASKSSLTDVVMTGYAADSTKTGAIAATDTLEQAFNKVENAIAAGNVHSNDQSITVAADATNGGTNIEVNVDGTTIVKDSTTHALKSGLTIAKITSGLGTNVKEAYQLQNASGTQIGTQIDIYKDSALKEVYLGASTDTIDASTGVITKNTVTDPQSMNFAYSLADGTYTLVKIDVSKFLSESEFGDGLTVSAGVVSVEIDSTSGKVRTAATPSGATPGSADDTGLVDVLTVSSNGVRVDNIQAAIDYAVQNSSTSLAISAEGDNYITAAVDANNNKKINVTADVQSLTATAGTPGVYDSTGTQTTAPVAGTLSGTADSLADGSDIASKVKTYVDGAIAIEGARSDAKNVADLKAAVESLDGEALASTAPTAVSYSGTNSDEFQVLTRVNEVDGIVQEVDATANSAGSKSVTLKKVAATGAAADVSIADAGSLITATTVEGALQEIAGNVQNVAIVSNDVIVATPDTANHNTKLSVTTGNGLEKTGANNDTLAVKAYNGINVTSNGVGVTIDTTSPGHSDMLSVGANGILLSDTWDCGTF